MSALTHYLEAKILPLDGGELTTGDMSFVTSRIMAAVHMHIVDGHRLAVAFPLMSEGKAANMGDLVRVFGTEGDLATLMTRSDFFALVTGAAISLGRQPIRPVPETSKTEVYRRSRQVEKAFEGTKTRQARRRARRGHVDNETPAAGRTKRRLLPFVNMLSLSTGQRKFNLFVERVATEGNAPLSAQSYGLGTPVPSF